MPNTGGQITAISNSFMDDLAAQEEYASGAMVQEYARRIKRLDGSLTDLEGQMLAKEAAGERIPVSWLHRQDSYRRLILQANDEFEQYGKVARGFVNGGQAMAVEKATQMARAQLGAAIPSELAAFKKLPAKAIERMVGNLQAHSPLGRILDGYGDWASGVIAEEMRHSLAAGIHPRQTMRNVKEKLDYAPTRAATIFRTEQLRAFRQSTLDTYKANSRYVKAWIWNAHTGDRTCPLCWAMHGTEWPLDEPMGTHPNCRCNMIPKTPTWAELGFPDIPEAGPDLTPGVDLFDRLPEAKKRKIVGPKFLEAMNQGQVKLADIVRPTYSRNWGKGIAQSSLKDAIQRGKLRESAERIRLADLAKQTKKLESAKTLGYSKPYEQLSVRDQRAVDLGLPKLPRGAPQWAKDVRKLQLDYKGDFPNIAKDAARVEKAGKILDDAAREYRLTPEFQKKMAEANRAIDFWDEEINRRAVAWKKVQNQMHDEGIPPSVRKTDPRVIEADRMMTEAYTAKGEAMQTWKTLRNDSHKAVLEQVRPFGPSQNFTFSPNSAPELTEMVDKMSQSLPRAWMDRAIDLNPGGIETRWADRGYHRYNGSEAATEIVVSGPAGASAESTMLHELTHYAERAGVDIKTQENHFYVRRTAGSDRVHLGPQYRVDEFTKPDDFVSPYMGKDYGRSAWEVLTMGVEGILGPEYTPGTTGVQDDLDHFYWLMGMVGIVP